MLDLTNENVYFVSDTHFNHHKLCSEYPDRFDRFRTYKYVNEMNEDMVDKWNKTVTKDDVVIFLGDFCYGRPFHKLPQMAKEFYQRLNFKGMIWVEGNHDDVIRKEFSNLLPNSKFKYKDNIYLCQHEPYYDNPPFLLANKDANVLVHGHTHSTRPTSKVDNLIQNNVCWEAWYRPVHIDELVINNMNNVTNGVLK